MLEIFELQFMQRALITGLILAVILAYLGVFVILRKMSFFADGIAHSSLAGVAIGILASFYPLGAAIIFSLLMGFLIRLAVFINSDSMASIEKVGYLFRKKAAQPVTTGVDIDVPCFFAQLLLSVSLKFGTELYMEVPGAHKSGLKKPSSDE